MWPFDALGYLALCIILFGTSFKLYGTKNQKVNKLALMLAALGVRNLVPLFVVAIRPFDPGIYELLGGPVFATAWTLIAVAGSIPFVMSLFKSNGELDGE